MSHQHTHRMAGEQAIARMRFAAQVRRARRELRLSQSQVDRLAGAAPKDTFLLENGESIPGQRRLRIMAVLGLIH